MDKKLMPAVKQIFIESAIVIASIYLTFIIDVYTLNTWPKRIFVFCYFLIICHAARFLTKKLQGDKRLPRHMLAAAGILAAAIVVLLHSTFFPTAQETTVSLAAVPSEDGSYHEVWLTAVRADGQELQLSQLEVDANQGWIYSGDNDDYVFYPAENTDNTNYLTFETTGKEFELTFAKNAWSGSVEVLANGENLNTLSLTGEADANGAAAYTIHAEKEYAAWEYVLYGLGAWAVLWFFVNVCASAGDRFCRKGWTGRKTAVFVLIFLNAGILFFSSERIQPTAMTKVCLLVLTGISAYCVNTQKDSERMKKYQTRGGYLCLGGISVYASLASFGQRFFLDGNTRMHGSLAGSVYCVSGFLWFLSIIWMLLCGLEWLSSRQHSAKRSQLSRRRAWWTLFAALAACQLVVLWIMWPGGFPSDSIDQLSQAVGRSGFNDWHPVMHTLLEKAVLAVIPNAGAITAVQMLMFTWLLTSVLMIGYDRGISLGLLSVIGGIFELLPNQALSWSNALKDFPFTLALLWGLFLLAKLAVRDQWSRKCTYYVCLALDIFLILTLRHNGIIPGVFIALLCVGLTFKYYAEIRLRAVASVLAAMSVFALYKGPLFAALDVTPNGMSPYTTMLCAVGSCINKDLPLSGETVAIMERVLPMEDWKEYYSRYHGHDIYWWGRPQNSTPYDTSSISTKDAFTVYFEALKKYPDVVIKDRLDGMDIMWDVAQPPDGFNAKSFNFVSPFNREIIPLLRTDGLEQQEDGSFVKNTVLSRAYAATEDFSINSISDILLWRTGAYLIAFFVLALFWWKNRMGRLWWAAIPMLGNIAGSVLVLYHQSFRYVYFIQVSVLALIFITVVLKQDWNSTQKTETSDEKLESGENHG